MFFAPDAQQYRNTSTEFFDFSVQGDSLTRPFFYPLIILFTYQTFGVFSLWIFQLLCWLISINLLFFSIQKMVKSPYILFVAISLISLNVSLIVFTLNGLSEILTVFLLSLLIHRLTNGSLQKNSGSLGNLLVMSLLTVTRPVFFYPFIIYLLFHSYRFLIREKPNLKYICILILSVSPVLFQITLMKVKHDIWKVSDIDSITLNDYLFAQTVREIEPGTEYQNSILKAREIKDKKGFIWNNKAVIFKLFVQNINESLEGYPSLFYIKEFEQVDVGKK
jgi:hypothetical protein